MKKLDYIDALRGLAILGVVMIHTNQYGTSNLPYIVEKFIGGGSRGVQLFYIASAFTLFLSFKNRLKVENFPTKNFFLRRFFRIAPMYYLGIIYYLFQDGLGPRYWLGDETHISVLNIISNLTFLHGFNPYWITSLVPGGWSIAVEMTFYAVLPFLFSKIKNLNHAFNFFLISILLKLFLHHYFLQFQLISDDRLWDAYLFLYFPSQLPVFCLGIIMYFIIIENNSIKNIPIISIVIFTGLVLAQVATGIDIFPNHIFVSIVFLLFGIILSKYRFKLIVNPVVKYIGKISFSMYLVHFAVLHWLTYYKVIDYSVDPLFNYVIRFIIVCILTIIISSILYNIIEVPFQEVGKKIIKKLEKNTTIQSKFS